MILKNYPQLDLDRYDVLPAFCVLLVTAIVLLSSILVVFLVFPPI